MAIAVNHLDGKSCGSCGDSGRAVHLVIAQESGRHTKLRDILRVTLRHFPPLLIGALLTWVAIMIGSLVFAIPGIMAACAFSVLTPAQSSEHLSIQSAFKRSRSLTSGNRWNIFGLGLIYVVLVGGVSAILLWGTGGIAGLSTLTFNYTVVLQLILNVIASSLSAAGAAVLYFELRRIKDGVGATDLAAVFD